MRLEKGKTSEYRSETEKAIPRTSDQNGGGKDGVQSMLLHAEAQQRGGKRVFID